jgi:hypothetical protein
LAADGKIYLLNFAAQVVVIDAAKGGIISQIAMDEPRDDAVRSSLAAAQGQLFVRTNTRLFCIGK